MAINWRFLDTGADNGARNMSLDEELLARAQAGDGAPVLRFYTWDPPAVYSIVSRIDNPLFPPDVLGTYKVIAAGLLAGLSNLGIDAEMVSHGGRHAALVNKTAKDPSCFSSPSWYEIVVHGKKIAGSAQRRLSGAFLQHGSILIAYDPENEAEVIPGGGGGSGVTCINRELGRDVPLAEVKEAFHAGFAEALRVKFT